jgi:hypothetical protein
MVTRGDDSFPPLQRMLGDAMDETAETDRVRARAIQLLRSVDQFQVPLGRKERLLFRLGQGHASRVRRVGWLRPIVIGAFLMGICGGAIASAGLTRWPGWIVRSYQKLVSASNPPALPMEANARPRRLPVKAVAVAPEHIEATDPPSPLPVAVPKNAETSKRATVRARRPPVEIPVDDAALLVEATRALRVVRDAGRARALARVYLERQPGGPLAEEALAISIEAALDHHDPDAAALSARYLAQFPHGSFRALAERTLASAR